LCFVCDSDARTVQYELVVRKLAEHLVTIEVEQSLLSKESNRAELPKILTQIMRDLNKSGLCTVTGNDSFTGPSDQFISFQFFCFLQSEAQRYI